MPSTLDELIEALRCLPGVGPKSAQRMAYHLLQRDQKGAQRLDRLIGRACDGVVQEVIVATNFTNEGEATAHYLAERLRAGGLKVTRIARGLPVGGELEHSDIGTVTQALIERRPL